MSGYLANKTRFQNDILSNWIEGIVHDFFKGVPHWNGAHAPLEQLVVLTNLESLNSVLIRQGLPQPARLATLNGIAITQMRTLLSANPIKRLK